MHLKLKSWRYEWMCSVWYFQLCIVQWRHKLNWYKLTGVSAAMKCHSFLVFCQVQKIKLERRKGNVGPASVPRESQHEYVFHTFSFEFYLFWIWFSEGIFFIQVTFARDGWSQTPCCLTSVSSQNKKSIHTKSDNSVHLCGDRLLPVKPQSWR